MIFINCCIYLACSVRKSMCLECYVRYRYSESVRLACSSLWRHQCQTLFFFVFVSFGLNVWSKIPRISAVAYPWVGGLRGRNFSCYLKSIQLEIFSILEIFPKFFFFSFWRFFQGQDFPKIFLEIFF